MPCAAKAVALPSRLNVCPTPILQGLCQRHGEDGYSPVRRAMNEYLRWTLLGVVLLPLRSGVIGVHGAGSKRAEKAVDHPLGGSS